MRTAALFTSAAGLAGAGLVHGRSADQTPPLGFFFTSAGPGQGANRHDGANPTSWNSAHASRGCSQENLRGTGGDGLFYCFAAR